MIMINDSNNDNNIIVQLSKPVNLYKAVTAKSWKWFPLIFVPSFPLLNGHFVKIYHCPY